MNINSAKNPAWANAEKTAIDLTVRFSHLDYEVPFTASPDDTELHGQEIFAAAVAGEFGEVAPYAAPVVDPAVAAAMRHAEILAALAEIDKKSIRPLREGDAVRIADLNAQAAAQRVELAKLV